jgi:hypothetical protein
MSEINVLPMVGKAVHDGVVGSQLVFVGSVDIRDAEDCVAATVESNSDVLILLQAWMGSLPVLLV